METRTFYNSILIVEDCDEDYDTFLHAFRHSGIDCGLQRALSGDDCLVLLRGSGEAEPLRPGLILMDLNTPGTDSRQTLSEIKKDEALKTIPLIVFTTSSNPGDLKTCSELGINEYYVKPLHYPDHLIMIEKILKQWLEPGGSTAGRRQPSTIRVNHHAT